MNRANLRLSPAYLVGRIDGIQEAIDHALDRLGVAKAMRDPYTQALLERRRIAEAELACATQNKQVA